MSEVKSHHFDPDLILETLEDELEEFDDHVTVLYEKMGDLIGIERTAFTILASQLGLNKRREDNIRYLHFAHDGLLTQFRISAPFEGSKTVNIRGLGEKEVVFNKDFKYWNELQFWFKGLFYSIILRDAEAQLVFLNYPLDVLLNANGNSEEFHFIYMDFLKLFLSRDKRAGQRFVDTFEATMFKNLKDKEYYPTVQGKYVPELDLFESLMLKDVPKFNERLFHALSEHKKVAEEMPNNVLFFVNIRLTGICALAYDRGMPIEVESPYIPKWMIKGNFD